MKMEQQSDARAGKAAACRNRGAMAAAGGDDGASLSRWSGSFSLNNTAHTHDIE